VVALHGELGSGKTCFAQGIARALGIERPVTSPTFTIIHEYAGRRRLCHIDLYRVRGPEEALALGFMEYLNADAITVIEWAERAGELIPDTAVHVYLEALPTARCRRIRVQGLREP
jgi:tRNA threonylcarbamoyladenosine biosynthesis protein TsaE